jgi:hypothetical protein
VLQADFNRRSTARLIALQKKHAPRTVPDREMLVFSRQTQIDEARELRAALGEEGYRAWDKEQTLHALNRARPPGDDLPMSDAEAEKAYRLQKEFDDKNRELQMAMEDGVADKADVGALQAQAQRELDRELGKLLGAERLAALRSGAGPAAAVYQALGDINATPAQVQALAQSEEDNRARQAALAARLKGDPAEAAHLTAGLKAINDAREAELRRILGEEAYEAVRRQNDPTYRTLRQYAGAWDLQESEIQSVYEPLRAFQDQAERTRLAAEMSEAAGQRVNWREIDASIDEARRQTEAGLLPVLGGERLHRLKQNGLLELVR